MKKTFKIALCLLAGFVIGTVFAKLDFPGYKHVMVMLMKGEAKPIYINGDGGRQVLALTIMNHQQARDIEVRMDGAEIQSWYPPVVKMPFSRELLVEGGKFRGIEHGKRLPVFVAYNDNGEKRKIDIID
ncbi:MAG: hypothetical protein M0017_08270, partial [Desulfobacteraceae bacterium]|nr:hypothetical protein [Desulfobacteraceae bacterium]